MKVYKYVSNIFSHHLIEFDIRKGVRNSRNCGAFPKFEIIFTCRYSSLMTTITLPGKTSN